MDAIELSDRYMSDQEGGIFRRDILVKKMIAEMLMRRLIALLTRRLQETVV